MVPDVGCHVPRPPRHRVHDVHFLPRVHPVLARPVRQQAPQAHRPFYRDLAAIRLPMQQRCRNLIEKSVRG